MSQNIRSWPNFFLLLAGVIFPLLVYFSVQADSVWPLSLTIFLLVVVRIGVTGAWHSLTAKLTLLVALALSLVALWLNNASLFKIYPVVMSFAVAMTFALSLKQPKTFLEEVAERFADLDAEEGSRFYLRRLTLMWAVLLIINGCFSAWTACCTSLQFWVAYNSLYSYLIMLCFGAFEWLYRQHYKRSRQASSPSER